jgi:hypothetical protein
VVPDLSFTALEHHLSRILRTSTENFAAKARKESLKSLLALYDEHIFRVYGHPNGHILEGNLHSKPVGIQQLRHFSAHLGVRIVNGWGESYTHSNFMPR